MKEQNRILWKRRIKENTSERNLLKSNICAEPKGRVAIGNSQKQKKKKKKEEFQEEGQASVEVLKYKRRAWSIRETS